MADDMADPEPIRFRTSRKRKAYRQRAPEDDDDPISTANSTSTHSNAKNDSISAPAPIPTAPPRASSPHRSFGEDDDDNDDDDVNDNEKQPADHPDRTPALDAEDSAAAAAAAAALRLRNSRRPARLRGMGMGFKSDAQPQSRSETPSQALVSTRDPDGAPSHDVDAAAVASGVDSRFMHQTGLLTILDDVHMNEFIEARLASRARQAAPQRTPNPHSRSSAAAAAADDDDDEHDRHSNSDHEPPAAARPAHAGIHSRAKDHQPARQGKLFEVAIPDDMRSDRDARDNKDKDKGKDKERAKDAAKRRRLLDPRDKDTERRRPGRTSDDMERDAMVEQFLHENRLDVYDVAEASSSSSSRFAPGKDFSADARLAEQFRRQYYEDLALRRKKRRPALSKKEQQQQRAAQATEVLKGPKLGGSRNQRAAIRNILLQQQTEKKA